MKGWVGEWDRNREREGESVCVWPRAHVLTIMLTTATVTISYRED